MCVRAHSYKRLEEIINRSYEVTSIEMTESLPTVACLRLLEKHTKIIFISVSFNAFKECQFIHPNLQWQGSVEIPGHTSPTQFSNILTKVILKQNLT